MQSSPLVQLAMWTWPDGWGKRPDGTLLPILSLAITKEDKESEELMETGPGVTGTKVHFISLRQSFSLGPREWAELCTGRSI